MQLSRKECKYLRVEKPLTVEINNKSIKLSASCIFMLAMGNLKILAL
jgi:hypothetical protein